MQKIVIKRPLFLLMLHEVLLIFSTISTHAHTDTCAYVLIYRYMYIIIQGGAKVA
jgi:hypothetical protein